MVVDDLQNSVEFKRLLNSPNPEAQRQALEIYNQAKQKDAEFASKASGVGVWNPPKQTGYVPPPEKKGDFYPNEVGGVYAGNSPIKEKIHSFYSKAIPLTTGAGAALGAQALTQNPLITNFAATGGYMTGQKSLPAVNALFGYKEPPSERRTVPTLSELATPDVLELTTGTALGAGIEKGLPLLERAFFDKRPLATRLREQLSDYTKPIVKKFRVAFNPKSNDETISTALHSIADNNSELKLIDPEFNTEGPLQLNRYTTQSLDDAIPQTQGILFKKYNDMTKNATGKGVMIDRTPIASELRSKYFDSETGKLKPEFEETFTPATKKFLDNQIKFMEERPEMTPDAMETILKNFNDYLKAWYENKAPNLSDKKTVMADIARMIRGQMDSIMEKGSGPAWAELRKQYGALNEIKDAVHRKALKLKNTPEFDLDVYDIWSAQKFISSVLANNPAGATAALTAKTLAGIKRSGKDPDYLVPRFMGDLDKKYNYSKQIRDAITESEAKSTIKAKSPDRLLLTDTAGLGNTPEKMLDSKVGVPFDMNAQEGGNEYLKQWFMDLLNKPRR